RMTDLISCARAKPKLSNSRSYLLQRSRSAVFKMQEVQRLLDNLIFYKTGPMSFQDKEIPPSVLEEILKAATSCTWLGRWKLVIITDKNQREIESASCRNEE